MSSNISIPHLYQHMGVSLILWLLVILAVLIDLWDGVYTARVLGVKIHSHKLRVTVRKIGEYWRIMLMGFVFDTVGMLFPFYAWPYASVVICVAITFIEFKSMIEHARKRKSHVAKIPGMLKDIIECATEHDALEIISKVQGMIEEENTKLIQK